MGDLRDRFDAELRLRGYAETTREQYLCRVRFLAKHTGRRPDELTVEEVRGFLLYLAKDRGVSWSTFNGYAAALRMFYRDVLDRDFEIERLPFQKKRRRLPVCLSREEVAAILAHASDLKFRTILTVMYATGLRGTEATHLRAEDIDSSRHVIRVQKGKGGKDRYVMLPDRLLDLLREYWRAYRPPPPWLFYCRRKKEEPMRRSSANAAFIGARKRAGIIKPATAHSLRHSFATHLLEDGTPPHIVRELLGHSTFRATNVYCHVVGDFLSKTRSPLESLPGPDSPGEPDA